jgi:hypothetical protein
MAQRLFLRTWETLQQAHSPPRAWRCHLQNPSSSFDLRGERSGQQFLLGREICGRCKFNMIRYIAEAMVELLLSGSNRASASTQSSRGVPLISICQGHSYHVFLL